MVSSGKKLRISKSMGKAQAREMFSTLIESVASGAGAVEITDYGKVKAVLISENEYRWLKAAAEKRPVPKLSPRGLISIDGDLESLSKEIAADFEASIKKTASEL